MIENESIEILKNIDISYVMNILRHQASKNHNKLSVEDLTLCIQIVSR